MVQGYLEWPYTLRPLQPRRMQAKELNPFYREGGDGKPPEAVTTV